MIVLDTHVLIWWIENPAQLSPKARRAIAKDSLENGIIVSSVSALEIATLVRRNRLHLAVSVDLWLANVQRLPELHFEPVTAEMAQIAGSIGDELHGDPVDRLIAATAVVLNAPLVTADTKLREYKGLDTVW